MVVVQLYTGIVTSALAVVLESIALAYVPATETAVIFRLVDNRSGISLNWR